MKVRGSSAVKGLFCLKSPIVSGFDVCAGEHSLYGMLGGNTVQFP